ncbi:Retrovirus-related Pol polyprotein from type-2 retrotransposable element R2DM, partial [Trichinella nelsoni]
LRCTHCTVASVKSRYALSTQSPPTIRTPWKPLDVPKDHQEAPNLLRLGILYFCTRPDKQYCIYCEVGEHLKLMNLGSALGPDGVKVSRFREISPHCFSKVFKTFLLERNISQILKNCWTSLIPILDKPRPDAEGFRSMTVGSCVYIPAVQQDCNGRLNKERNTYVDGCVNVLTEFLRKPNDHQPHPPPEKRTKEEEQNIRSRNQPLCNLSCTVDVAESAPYQSKRFPPPQLRKYSVPHFGRRGYAALQIDVCKNVGRPRRSGLKIDGFDTDSRALIWEVVTGCTTVIKGDGGVFRNKIEINQGVRQGDPISHLPFNSVMDELIERLEQSGVGYKIGSTEVVTLAFADDVTLLSSSRRGMEKLLSITHDFVNERGLRVPDTGEKYTYIPMAGPGELIKVLGYSITPNGKPSFDVDTLEGTLERIRKAPLKPAQKLATVRDYLIPAIEFKLGVPGDGGLGLRPLRTQHIARVAVGTNSMMNSADPTSQAIASMPQHQKSLRSFQKKLVFSVANGCIRYVSQYIISNCDLYLRYLNTTV